MIWVCMTLLLACHNEPDTSHLEKDLLHVEAKIPLPGVSGRIDHLAYDAAGHRLFVAALGNNTVEVVDLTNRKRLRSITGLHEPQGVQYLPGIERLAIANGGDGACVFYECKSYTEIGRVALGDDADNVRFDGSRVFVGYGSGAIAVVDPVTIKKLGELSLKGHPESFQLGDSGRMFVNVPDADEIVPVDLNKMLIGAAWANNKASANFPMALDTKGGQIFIAYRHPAEVRILDSRTGSVRASMSCVGDADDVFFDAGSGLLFVSGGEGFVDIFRREVLINHIPTRKGARTCLWLQKEKKLVLAVPARGGEEAELWIYGF
jgi:YVTN family beta-propeller protein